MSARGPFLAHRRKPDWQSEESGADSGAPACSPVAHLKKPGCGRKEIVVSRAEFTTLVDLINDEEFRDLCEGRLGVRRTLAGNASR